MGRAGVGLPVKLNHENEQATGRRLLDVFTVHYYPQGGEFGTNTTQAMQLRRNRSTRSLWDPNYVDETWINNKDYRVIAFAGALRSAPSNMDGKRVP